MNKIVREHYPVENLPEDLRALVGDAESVTVELTQDNRYHAPLSKEQAIALMRQMQKENVEKRTSISTEEAVARIRELRDEWDD
tara:strand:+ start:1072 stop:1323 length:252 start_codon:yes stop_codon:yes gene_type:complete